MDYSHCNVVYVDRAAREDKLVKRGDGIPSISSHDGINESKRPKLVDRDSTPLDVNLQTLLESFTEVHVCTSGKSCFAKLSELNRASLEQFIPTVVLIDIPYEDQWPERSSRGARTPSPGTKLQVDGAQDIPEVEDAYGIRLLQWIASDMQYHAFSKLIVPIAVVALPGQNFSSSSPLSTERLSSPDGVGTITLSTPSIKDSGASAVTLDQTRTKRCLDVGAVDVLTSPLLHERLPSLGIHAYRAHKDAFKSQKASVEVKRGRKRSWVGFENQPFQYLREVMVSGLMESICKPDGYDSPVVPHAEKPLTSSRQEKVAMAIGQWGFSAHEFTEQELLHAALLMLQHALSMPELEKWRMSTEKLTGFLVASRNAYNSFVPYHNFRHVIDVLQATFHFLLSIGRLPKYPFAPSSADPVVSPIAALIRPFDALTLLITAIGHDVGHPGVNNAFLVALNAPLAQLYNDNSVLESFHCAAYSQILRRHWPAAFLDLRMRKLMISSILATDMGLHSEYMKQLGNLQEKLHENGGTDGWDGRDIEAQRALACSILIKCADISNVAREFNIAGDWTNLLTEEFSRQASMEEDLKMASTLMAPPTREPILLAKSQLGFMNFVAIPLFEGATDIMPALEYCIKELQRNKKAWEAKIARPASPQDDCAATMDGMLSPRSMSLATPSDGIHQNSGSATNSYDSNNVSKMFFKPNSKHIPDESAGLGHYHAMPELSKSECTLDCDSNGPSTAGQIPSSSTRASKLVQLRLGYDPTSLSGLMSHSFNAQTRSRDPSDGPHGAVPEADSLAVNGENLFHQQEERKSDATETTNSVAGDLPSQATSATSGNMPLSPSTKGTSISTQHSTEGVTPTGASPLASTHSQVTPSSSSTGKLSEEPADENKGIAETVRGLKKKPSRNGNSEI